MTPTRPVKMTTGRTPRIFYAAAALTRARLSFHVLGSDDPTAAAFSSTRNGGVPARAQAGLTPARCDFFYAAFFFCGVPQNHANGDGLGRLVPLRQGGRLFDSVNPALSSGPAVLASYRLLAEESSVGPFPLAQEEQ